MSRAIGRVTTALAAGLIIVASGAVVAGCKSRKSDNGSGGGGAGTPAIASIVPNTGIDTGGTSVVITITSGTFTGTPAVTFGGAAATLQTFTGTTVTVTTPSGSVGPVPVTVDLDGSGTTVLTAAAGFTYQGMEITAVTPSTGPAGGGTAITITGIGFDSVTDVDILNPGFGQTPTQLTGTLKPGSAGTVDVTVTSSTKGTATRANAFTYTGSSGGGPTTGTNPNVGIVALAPITGPTGVATAVTLTGDGFDITATVDFTDPVTGTSEPATVLLFGEEGDTQLFDSGGTPTPAPGGLPLTRDTLVIETPTGFAQTVLVDVTVTVGSDADTLPQAYTFINPLGTAPVLTAVSPATGPEAGGTSVTLTGTGFLGADIAMVGSALLNFQIIDDTTIIGKTAPLSGAGAPQTADVVVVSAQTGTSNILPFTYTPSLFLERLDPNQGPVSGGQIITITGRNFESATGTVQVADVLFDGISATRFNVIDAETLSVTVPPGPGEFAVSVKLVGQGVSDAERPNAYVYGEVFKAPQDPGQDPLDLGGDETGPATGSAGLADIDDGVLTGTTGRVSKVAGGDITAMNGEFVAVTLPRSRSVYIRASSLLIETNGSACLDFLTRFKFEFTHVLSATEFPTDLVWTDIDRDRVPDVVVALEDGTFRVVRLFVIADPGQTKFDSQLLGTTFGAAGTDIRGIGTGDFDNDGFLDIAVARDDSIDVYLNDQSNGFTAHQTITISQVDGYPATNPSIVKMLVADPFGAEKLGLDRDRDVAIVDTMPKGLLFDLNRDSKCDIITLNDDGTICAVFGEPQGATVFDPSAAGRSETFFEADPIQGTPIDAALTDFNRDNRLDVAVLTGGPNGRVTVVKSATNPLTKEVGMVKVAEMDFPAGANPATPTGITVLDANIDCDDDIIVSTMENGGPNVALYLNNADGAFATPQMYVAQVPGNLASTFQILDISRSRRASVWALSTGPTTGQQGLIEIDRKRLVSFLGDAPNTMVGPLATGIDPRGLRFADLNDDGAADMVYCNFTDATVRIHLGNGDGSFGTTLTRATGPGPEALAVGDIDNDGDQDVVVANNLNGVRPFDEVSVHLNTGFGAIGAITSFVTDGRGPRDVQLADLDNDGALDLLVVNQTSNNVSILKGNGDGTFAQPAIRVGIGNRPMSLAIADMGAPEWTLAYTPGDSTATPTVPATITTDPLEPDGFLDLVFAVSGDDTVTILYGGYDGAGLTNQRLDFGQGEAYSLRGFIEPDVTQLIATVPAPALLRTGTQPSAVRVVDMNGDGRLDIVVAEQGTDTVTILHANTQLRPSDPRFDLTPAPTSASACAGMNARLNLTAGQPIAGARGSTALIRKYFIPRDYRYTGGVNDLGRPQITLPVGSRPQFLEIADMNVDGLPDLLAGSLDGNVRIYIQLGPDFQDGGQGPGTNSVPASGPCNTIPPGYPGYNLHPDVIPSAQVQGVFVTGNPSGDIDVRASAFGETAFRSPRLDPACPPTVNGYSHDSDVATFFDVDMGGPITGLDVARISRDCPPDVGATTATDTVLIKQGR